MIGRIFDGARHFFANGNAHAAHEKTAVQHGRHHFKTTYFSRPDHCRFIQIRLLALLLRLLRVPFKMKRIRGKHVPVHLMKRSFVEDERKTKRSADRAVFSAVRTDVEILFPPALQTSAPAGRARDKILGNIKKRFHKTSLPKQTGLPLPPLP